MQRRSLLVRVPASLVILMAACCVPKRVHWAPDGQHAFILTEEKTWLMDAEGRLSDPPRAIFEQVAWFADSKRFAGVAQETLSTWAAVREQLTDEQAARLIEAHGEFREQILEHQGSWDGWAPKLEPELSGTQILALWVYTREQKPEELKSKLGPEWEKISQLGLTLRTIQTGELTDRTVRLGRPLVSTINGVAPGSLHVAPDGRKLAYVATPAFPDPRGDGESPKASDMGGTLMLLPLGDSAEPLTVAPFAAWRSDFTADSRSLVYATAKPIPQDGGFSLGSIQRRQLTSEPGPVGIALGEPEDLAGILYFPDTRIICTDDGRVLFSAAAMSLPMATADTSAGLSLFSLDPQRRATIAPMLTHAVQTKGLTAGFEHGTFDIRPDGTGITLLGSGEDGEVACYALPTGQLEYVVEKKDGWKLLEQPAWRSGDEISLVVPPGHEWGSPDRPELVLYSISSKQTRVISKAWPAELVQAFAAAKPQISPASQSASSPPGSAE